MSDAEIPEMGGSVTIDSDGHFAGAEVHVEVPGAAEGSDPLQYEFHPHSEDHDPPAGPGWMPNLHPEPAFDPTDIMHAPVPEGWERDNLGLLHPHLDLGGHDEPADPQFQLHMPEFAPEHHEPHLDVPELHLDPEFGGDE